MDLLKKIFPLSFRSSNGNVVSLIIGILVYLVVGVIAGWVIGLLMNVPVVNIVVGLVAGLLDVYCLAGIVILVLVWCKILK